MDFESMSNDELTEHYLEIGALDLTIGPDGEFMYVLGENAKETAPEFYEAWMSDLDDTILDLYNLGFIDVDYNEDLEATFNLTDEGRKAVEAARERQ